MWRSYFNRGKIRHAHFPEKSGDRDSNPGKFALQANAVAAVPSPHKIIYQVSYLNLIVYDKEMIKNLFSSITKKLNVRETKHFQVLLVISYIFIIISLYPVGKALLNSLIYFSVFIIYFLPYLILNIKKHETESKIFWINLLLGWTIIIWIILIVKAIEFQKKKNKSKKTSD